MTVGTRHRTRESPDLNIMIDINKIKPVHNQKLLGIYIDGNLLWAAHINYLCATISSKISQLKQLSFYIQTEIQKTFNQRYILQLHDYGSNTWGTTSKQNIERLCKIQRRAARTITLKE